MENMIKGLDLEELEAHSYAELLPDRIEMHRRRSMRRSRSRVPDMTSCASFLIA